MAHLTTRSAYQRLTERLDRTPEGVHPSQLLQQILGLLFTESEADLAAQLPLKPFTVKGAARRWKLTPSEAQKRLDRLADKGLLLDFSIGDEQVYVMPPPVIGFFEFSLMRVRPDIDQELLSKLLHQYMSVEEDFIKQLFSPRGTPPGRVFVQEPVLPTTHHLEVMDYERASETLHAASEIAVGMCFCRHKMMHLGHACDRPMEICMTLNVAAESLNRHGITRKIDVAEAIDLLDQAYESQLVQFGENVQEHANFLCHCCGCCCEALGAARRFAFLRPVQTSNYLPVVQDATCKGCGKCVSACPVEAMALVSANDPNKKKKKRAKLEGELCLGCGVCVRECPSGSLAMAARPQRVMTPVNSAHRSVLRAIERGTLQTLLTDNEVFGHRGLAAVLGVILELPPAKQALANKQLKSRYLGTLLSPFGRHIPKVLLG